MEVFVLPTKGALSTSLNGISAFPWAPCLLTEVAWGESESGCACGRYLPLPVLNMDRLVVLLLLHSRQLCSSGLLIAILHELSMHISNGTLSSYDAVIKDETGVLSAGSQMLCSLVLIPSRWQGCQWSNVCVWTCGCSSGTGMWGTLSDSWAFPAGAFSLPSLPRFSLFFALAGRGVSECSGLEKKTQAKLEMFQLFCTCFNFSLQFTVLDALDLIT